MTGRTGLLVSYGLICVNYHISVSNNVNIIIIIVLQVYSKPLEKFGEAVGIPL